MIKKDEAEAALHHLFFKWSDERYPGGLSGDDRPNWYEFKDWLDTKHYGVYLRFRSRAGAQYDAEMWFDKYFRQKRMSDHARRS